MRALTQLTFQASIRSRLKFPVDGRPDVNMPIARLNVSNENIHPVHWSLGSDRLHTNDIVQPVILWTPRFKHKPQMQMTIWSFGARCLNEDISTVVGA